MDEESLFHRALEKSVSERPAFLAENCAGDDECRRRVEVLIEAHDNTRGFLLDAPPAGLNVAVEPPISERPGADIGPYKLLQQIGEGGMGVVFMAEQKVPMQRTVALKIIKPGMDTRQVISRFEAERQALAVMDHPNIAKVLDAGTTATGKPYFVMELVKGVPITRYCDDKQLPLQGRLDLFIKVSGPHFGGALNNAGQIAFAASLTGSGVDSMNDRGIWATDHTGALQLIARTGDLLEVAPANFRTIRELYFVAGASNSDGRPSGFNNFGQLAFWARFTDGTEGVFVSNRVIIAEPASLALLALGVPLLTCRKTLCKAERIIS